MLADRVTVATSKRPGALALIDRAGARSSPRISSQLDENEAPRARRCARRQGSSVPSAGEEISGVVDAPAIPGEAIARLLGEAGALDVGVHAALEVNLHRIAFLRSRRGVILPGGWRHSSRGPVARAYIRDGSA